MVLRILIQGTQVGRKQQEASTALSQLLEETRLPKLKEARRRSAGVISPLG